MSPSRLCSNLSRSHKQIQRPAGVYKRRRTSCASMLRPWSQNAPCRSTRTTLSSATQSCQPEASCLCPSRLIGAVSNLPCRRSFIERQYDDSADSGQPIFEKFLHVAQNYCGKDATAIEFHPSIASANPHKTGFSHVSQKPEILPQIGCLAGSRHDGRA